MRPSDDTLDLQCKDSVNLILQFHFNYKIQEERHKNYKLCYIKKNP